VGRPGKSHYSAGCRVARIDAQRDADLRAAKDQLWLGKDYTNWFKDYVVGYELPYHGGSFGFWCG